MARKYNSIEENVTDLFRLKPLPACIKLAIASGMFLGSMSPVNAGSPLPVPAQLWTTYGSATQQIIGNTLQVNQKSDRAILNWKEFNVAEKHRVDFKQPGVSSIALNRISPNGEPSQILGSITANGQVYLYNPDGVLFGKNSTVDVHSMVASSLNISDEVFKGSGIANAYKQNNNSPAFSGGASPNSKIEVLEGAKLHVGETGRLILAAPNVINSGNLSADKFGQILLVASKDKIYLSPKDSSDPFFGLLVEVGSGGQVTNQGNILARQGNITMAGFAVNQNGRATATTATNVNGSIRLIAREQVGGADPLVLDETFTRTTRPNDLEDKLGTKATVTFGSGSVTQVVADKEAGKGIDELEQPKSYLEAYANTVHLKSGSAIGVPGGTVKVSALDTSGAPSTARILIDKGASIDVSGAKNITESVSRNVVEVPVQSFELRDSPQQKGGVLKGFTVRVDVRDKNSIIDISGGLARIERGVDERLARLGPQASINLETDGDLIVNPKATVNISGGTVKYTAGFINTSKLLTDYGEIVDIGEADPNLHYQAVFGAYKEVHEKWGVTKIWQNNLSSGRFEQGYQEGLNAGALNIKVGADSNISWNGILVAGSASGLYQRSLDKDAPDHEQIPNGGQFTIAGLNENSLFNQNIVFGSNGNGLNIGLNQEFPKTGDDESSPLVLSSEMINRSGIGEIKIKTRGAADILADAKINMHPGSTFDLAADQGIDVAGQIYSAGGSINMESGTKEQAAQLTLASTALFDVSGRWVNDFSQGLDATPTEALAINGGNVTLKATGDLDMQSGAAIKADGGAWLSQDENLNAGEGGSIDLVAAGTNTSSSTKEPSLLHLNGNLSAYGVDGGGSLSLTSGSIIVDPVGAVTDENNPSLVLGVKDGQLDLEGIEGFAQINLTSAVDDLVVKEGTTLKLIQQNRVLDPSFKQQASDRTIASFSHLEILPETLRKPVDLSLTADGNVILETGTKIIGDNQSTINLVSTGELGKGIFVDGLISVPAGAINLNINTQGGDNIPSTQAIWLGRNAQLLAKGATLLNPVDALERRSGDVLDGGKVTLDAKRGYVVLEQSSAIDVSGTQATLDLPTGENGNLVFAPAKVGSKGGTVSLTSAQGIILDGDLQGKAGNDSNLGGQVNISLDSTRQGLSNPITIQKPINLNVRQDQQRLLSDSTHFGDDLNRILLADNTGLTGNATVSSAQISRGGFDDVRLSTINTTPFAGQTEQTSVNFLGDVTLSARARIDIDAPNISWKGLGDATAGSVNINTAYFRAGTTFRLLNNIRETTEAPNLGGGLFTANTQWTQFEGASRWDNFNTININSSHDIRAVGLPPKNFNPGDLQGNFVTAANVNLKASQLYPSTLSKFTFAIENNPDGIFTVTKNGHDDSAPLSAAGSLTINAPVINQDGTIKAPFGDINLDATKELTLGAGSLTSVSGAGLLIPFGNTFAGQDWLYPYIGSQSSTNPFFVNVNSPPEKKLRLSSPSIDVKAGSTVDLSGGGDLLAYEFQSGIGGSFDYLDSKGKFAIVPGLGSDIAPYDSLQSFGYDEPVGSQVFLKGTGQLKAGFYTLLPAHYALLPGAFLVTPQSGTQDQQVTTIDSAGLSTVAGYRAVAGSGTRDSRWSGFLIEDGKEIRKHSQYEELKANDFFTQRAVRTETLTPILPRDAGQLVINNVENKLALDGELKTAAPGGRGARVDLAAKNLKIVNALSASPAEGFLEVLAGDLNGLHADSLLLGGERSRNLTTGATQIDVTSDEVVFENKSNIQGTDLIATAKNQVTVESGATLTASGTVNTGDSQLDIKGDGALLRVSADRQVVLNRTAEEGSTLGKNGNLQIEAGSTLAATKAILLDATKTSNIAGDIKMTGGSLNLGANGINIGEVEGNSVNINDGLLNLSNRQFSNLTVDELVLTSRDTVNFYGNVGLQDANGKFNPLKFNRLELNARGFAGFGNNDDFVGLRADSLVLQNSSNLAPQTAGTGHSRLMLSANNYSQGGGVFTINGFDDTKAGTAVVVDVADSVKAVADNGFLKVDANLEFNSGYITSDAGKSMEIDATGHKATLKNHASNEKLPAINEYGGTFKVKADDIIFNTQVVLPSGTVSLTSLKNDILVGPDAKIDLAGRKVPFADVFAYTPGGLFSAAAKEGKITLAENSILDLSTGGGSASCGKLNLSATKGYVELAGEIKAKGGSAVVDVANFNDKAGDPKSDKVGFDTLADDLMTAGISNELYIRSRQADILKHSSQDKDSAGKLLKDASGGTIQDIAADKITLVSDRGNVEVSGAINADNTGEGGNIKLLAGDAVILKDGAALRAKANDVNADGGKIILASTDADNDKQSGVEINAGSSIDVSGGSAGKGGEVSLRALRTDENADGEDDGVNIKPIAGVVRGYSGFYADGVKKYDEKDIDKVNLVNGQIDAAVIAKIKVDTENYMSVENMANVAKLGKGIALRPGIEINYDGDLKLTEAWDFISWGNRVKYLIPGSTLFPIGVEDQRDYLPGLLNINVKGNFRLERAISDGFTFTQFPLDGKQKDTLQTNDSWSYQLVAGADLTSADKSSIIEPSSPDSAKKLIVAENSNQSIFDLNNALNIHSTVIRTGTGDIALAASGNVDFESSIIGKGVSVYTAGKATKVNPYGSNGPAEIGSGTSKVLGDFPINGGSLTIRAGNSINGALNQDPYNSSGWLIRRGNGLTPEGVLSATSWGIDFGAFKQNIGAFGGGNVDIKADGNISDVVVAMPTTGKQTGELNVPDDPSLGVKTNRLQIDGGGQLQVNAGGDVAGGVFYLGKGIGVITAAGAVTGSKSLDPDPANVNNTVADLTKGPQLLMGDSDLTINAGKDLVVSAVSDPMVIDSNGDSHFFSYGGHSALHFNSLAGDVTLGTDNSVVANVGSNAGNDAIKIYPASLNVTAFTGNILLDEISSPVILFPSEKGDLNLYANGDIARVVEDNVVQGFGMSDVDPNLLPVALTPVGLATITGATQDQNISGLLQTFQNIPQSHALTPLHENDNNPVRIVSQTGDIKGLTLNLPKKAIIQSGRDLINSNIDIQHANRDNDVSIISAKRDVRYPIQRDIEDGHLIIANIGMRVAGKGDVLLKSGRDIDFGLSEGLTTIGNEFNPNLNKSGAGVTVLTGLNGAEPNYLGLENLDQDVLKYADNFNKVQELVLSFMKDRTGNTLLTAKKAYEDFKALDPVQVANLQPKLKALESSKYLDLLQQIKTEMAQFIRQRNANPGLTEAEALKVFTEINPDEYLALQPKLNNLTNQILYSELEQTALASAADKTLGNVRGFDAIKAVYSDKHVWKGDLNLFFSQLQTKRDGDINLLVPGGEINVGLPVGNAGIAKTPDKLGIAVQGKGDFNAFLQDDFNVNQSRVFTLGGGGVLVWSSIGDIDAGRGAKSSLAAPNPLFSVDQNGDLVVTTPPPVSGSGIRTSAPPLGGKPGDVTLAAPGGVVNASEAGIAGNNVTISATAVLGAGNISIGGVGTGVPTTSNVSVAAGLTGVSNLNANVSQVAQAAADMSKGDKDDASKSHQLGTIKVELLGFGDGSASNKDDNDKGRKKS